MVRAPLGPPFWAPRSLAPRCSRPTFLDRPRRGRPSAAKRLADRRGLAARPFLTSAQPGEAPTDADPMQAEAPAATHSRHVAPFEVGAATSAAAASIISRSGGPGTQRAACWGCACEGISDGISVQWWRRPLRAVTAWSHQNARGRGSGPRAERPLRARWRPSAPKSGIASATAPWQESRTPLHPHPCSALHRR